MRKVILRDHIDISAADQLEALLRGGGLLEAAVVISEAVIGRQVVPAATWDRVVRASVHALIEAEERLAPQERRTSAALASSNAQCPRCTAAELCGSHQQVLWRWWDLRDAAAVGVVNAVVAARAVPPPARPSAQQAPRRIPSRGRSQS